MKTRSSITCALIFPVSLLIGACSSGSGNSESNPDPDPTACSTQLLSQLCGTTWVSDCLDQTTHYTRITHVFNNDETFSSTGRNYSDSGCTTETSSLAYSGNLIEGEDIALLDGSTGRKMDLSISMYDGNDIDPPTLQYTIMQIDSGDPGILYMGDTHDTAAERDSNNLVRTSAPYRKQ